MNINSNIKRREGSGSYFHKENTIKVDFIHLNFDYDIFYSGVEAFKCIWNEIHRKKRMTEQYYKTIIIDWIKHIYDNIIRTLNLKKRNHDV